MFKGISPKQMKKIAKQMGVKMEEVEALEVVIKLEDKKLIFENPQVTTTKVMGQNTFQIAGDYVEKIREISEEDVKLVSKKAKCDTETARKALESSDGDLAKAILKIKGM